MIDKFNRELFKVEISKPKLRYNGKQFYIQYGSGVEEVIDIALEKNLIRVNNNYRKSLECNGKEFEPKRLLFYNPEGDAKHQLSVKNGKFV